MLRRLQLPTNLLALCLVTLLAPLALACDVSSILVAVVGKPTPTLAPTATTAPTATGVPAPTAALPVNIVINAVTSKDVGGATFNPVGITDSFPADQSIFHVVVTISSAPDNTNVKVKWLTASNALMGDTTLSAGGTRNLDYTFKPDAGRLPPGGYQAQIYVNDKLDRTLTFSVMPPAGTSAPAPVAPKPSGVIASVTMAAATTGNNFDPVNPTVSFKSTDTFHAVATILNAPENTMFTATWYVVDVGNAAPPNSELDSSDISTGGSRNIDFRISPATTWPAGSYRVEILVNGVTDTVKTFSVQ